MEGVFTGAYYFGEWGYYFHPAIACEQALWVFLGGGGWRKNAKRACSQANSAMKTADRRTDLSDTAFHP